MARMREGVDGVYLVEELPLEEDQVPEELRERLTSGYEPFLRIALWYRSDSTRRGLKLSVVRMMRGERSEVSVMTAKHNGFLHVYDMARKSDRKGERIAAIIRGDFLEEIREFALASTEPSWPTLQERLQSHLSEAVA